MANTWEVSSVLILASASPRRRDLLTNAGVDFVVDVSNIPEAAEPHETPAAFVRRVAAEKARAVACRHPGQLVLAADTIVVIDDGILGKPRDRADARRMLRQLSGRDHVVLTGVALIDRAGDLEHLVIETTVRFRPIPDAELEAYLDGGEPYDKAGAYAAQGAGSSFIAAMEGSRSNVIGLPMEATLELLRRHGVIGRQDAGV